MKRDPRRRYCRQVKSLLPCHGKQKKHILTELKINISAFLAENPEADYAAVVARFGTPQSVAAAYVDGMDTGALLRSLRIRRRIVRITAGTLTVALLMWAGVVIGAYVKFHNQRFHSSVHQTIREID